jgi:NADH:quinone reductase (non-electrogenic)
VLRRQRNARVLLADVTDFDLDARTVITGDGPEIPYDSLIVAAGATHGHRGPEDGSDLAPGLKSLDDVRDVRSRILRAFELAELADDPEERAAWMRFAVVGHNRAVGTAAGLRFHGRLALLVSALARNRGQRVIASHGSLKSPTYNPAVNI